MSSPIEDRVVSMLKDSGRITSDHPTVDEVTEAMAGLINQSTEFRTLLKRTNLNLPVEQPTPLEDPTPPPGFDPLPLVAFVAEAIFSAPDTPAPADTSSGDFSGGGGDFGGGGSSGDW